MRKRFEVQTTLGLTPLSDLLLPTTSRDELAPTLAGLQCIFLNPSLNEQIFALVEEKIPAGLQNTKGRAGMSLWEILVLAVCRLTLDANYDRIHDLANHHSLIRHLMQVSSNSFTGENKSYGLQTIKDNLMLLDEATIMKINELVVAHAHHLVLKKNEKLRIKSDTFVFETNIHFPTDYNLLWDSARKCLDILDVCSRLYDFAGWRKLAAWRSELKNLSRAVGKASSFTHKNKERAVVQAAQAYVDKAKKLEKKISESVFENWETIVQDIELSTLIEKDLVFFLSMLTKHIDLVERRLIRKEVIASSEKIHSIFELHTEWISKGKLNKAIELGHNLLISTDQFGFILRSKVVEKQSDSQLVLALADDLLLRYTNKIESMSFDKGFYSQENKTLLSFAIEKVILPKKGKRCAAQQAEESAKEFKKLRYAHSAIESNINQLEHHGLNRCPDKGFHRYKTYVSLGILSYNLCKLGKIILAKQANARPQASQVWQQAA